MATLIPDETIRDIQRAADIVDVISKRVILKKTGKNFVGLCPFHTEKTPSFSVNPEKKIFYCFGCGVGGDVFSFLMKLDGINFLEAVQHLARQYGIEILEANHSPNIRKALSEKERIYKINQAANGFYHKQLLDMNRGRRASTYLAERGMTPEIIKKFQLGYAPPGWENLGRYLNRKKVSFDLLKKAGLVIERKEGQGHYDRFRDRIMFPIFDGGHRVIAFGGRVMDKSLPKYLNSPETPVYHKGGSLYGAHCARQACRQMGMVYLVEGYFDLIALHLYEIENSVATLGTALTQQHVQILRGFVGQGGKAILVFDSDEAGIKAAARSIPVFETGFLEAQVLVLPDGYDPDTYIRQYGRDQFLRLAQNALGIVGFLLESAIKRHGLSIDGKIKILQEMVPPLATLTDTVARSLHIKSVGERLGIDENAVLERVRQFTPPNIRSSNDSTKIPQNFTSCAEDAPSGERSLDFNQRVKIERKLIAMMLNFPGVISEIIDRKLVGRIQDQTLKAIGKRIIEMEPLPDNLVDVVMNQLEKDGLKKVVASLIIENEKWDAAGCQRLMIQFERSVKREDDDLIRRIKVAEKNDDYELLKKLLAEKQMAVRGRRQRF